MKKIIGVLILFLGIGTMVFFKRSEELILKTSQKVVKVIPRVSLKKSKYIISAEAKSMGTFPEVCESALKDLSALTMEEYKDIVINKQTMKTFFGEECFRKLLSNKTFESLIKSSGCQSFTENSCLTMMFMLKAFFIADHTVGKSPGEMNSQELASNFVKMFFGLDSLNKEKFQENLKLLNSFYEMHSNDPDVVEAYLGYLMIGKQITQDGSVSSKIDELLASSSGDSFKLDRLNVVKDVIENNLPSAKANLDRLKEQYPQEPDVAYYQAAYHWKQGNREMAGTYLDQAIQLSKNCISCTPDLYADTKRKLGEAQRGDDKLFAISIGLNFENL
jgi:tetratricopeptide (TPR) repeat protein